MNVPPISGLRDDVAFVIDGLDLSGFHVENENVSMAWGEFNQAGWDGTVLHMEASGINAVVKGLTWCFRKTSMLGLSAKGLADCVLAGMKLTLGFKLVRRPHEPLGAAAEGKADAGVVATDKTHAVNLVLASKSLSFEKFELKIEGSTVRWVCMCVYVCVCV